MNWIRSNPILAGVIAAVLIAAVVAFFAFRTIENKRHEGQLTNLGATTEQVKSQSEVINHVKEANSARDNPTGNELNIVCGKYDRNC